MEIISLSDLPKEDWSAFVDECNECWLYHHPAFFDWKAPDSVSFALHENGKISGGCVLYINRSGLGKVLGGRYGPAGLALEAGAARRAYPLVRNHLVNIAKKHGCHAIQMGLPILAPAFGNSEYLDTHLYHLGFNNTLRWGDRTSYTPSYSTVIDLKLPKERIWQGFADSIRRKCRSASKFKFTIEFQQSDVSEYAWEAFKSNHSITMRRAGGESLPLPLLETLYQLLLKNLACLVGLRIGEEIVASLLLLTYKKSAFAFAIGVQNEAYRDGFAAQVRWAAVDELAQRGFEKYEVGSFFPALHGTKLQQLGEFKRRFGGEKRAVLAGEFVTDEFRFVGFDLIPAYTRKLAKSIYEAVRKE